MDENRLLRRPLLGTIGLVVLAAAVVLLLAAWSMQHRGGEGVGQMPPAVEAPDPARLDEAAVSRITAFCSDCHAMPRPENFPRDRWHHEVN